MNLSVDRRGFLGSAVAAAFAWRAAGTAPAGTLEQPTDRMPIVDTHQHLWDLGKFRLPWIKQGSPLARSFLVRDYLEATAGLNVVKAVYMEVDVEPAQQAAEAAYVINLCQRGEGKMAAAVISGRPSAEGFRPYITPFRDSRWIKGVRQVLHGEGTPPGYCLAERFVRGIRLLGELGLSFDLCLRPGELADGGKLIDACPDTRFILDHCGNPNVQTTDPSTWKRDLAAVARRKNVVCKVSGIVTSARPGCWTADDLAPFVNHTLDVFGPQRVLFGGDWPVCTLAATYRQWVAALGSIVASRPLAEQRQLFHDNAVKFYGLS
ncbi:MAG: amidohydrolase family protein [Gemmataceae bacterium]|nr:amidohydrolase family protein [Gemmataceae bacterium]